MALLARIIDLVLIVLGWYVKKASDDKQAFKETADDAVSKLDAVVNRGSYVDRLRDIAKKKRKN